MKVRELIEVEKVLLEIRGIIDLSDEFTKTERLEQTKTYIFNKLNEIKEMQNGR